MKLNGKDIYLSFLKGDKGDSGPKGDKGDTALSVKVGKVTTSRAGTTAKVTNSGTNTDLILDFNIPKGDTGPQGPQGPRGDSGVASGVVLSDAPGTSNTNGYTQNAVNNLISNPNLLINGDFRVNQRGLPTYNSDVTGGGKYTVDRWQFGGNGIVDVNSSGILYTCLYSWNGLRQYIESPSKLSNKTVTFSMKYNASYGIWIAIKLNDTELVSAYSIVSNTDRIITVTTTLPEMTDSDKLQVSFTLANPDDTVQLYWAKLEIGSVATAFSPRPYAEELALCQRYYYRFWASQTYSNMLLCMSTWTATNFMGIFTLPQEMRQYPTVVMSGSFRLAFNNTTEEVVSVTRTSYSYYAISLTFTVTTGKAWITGYIQSNNDNQAYIEFDSEIY